MLPAFVCLFLDTGSLCSPSYPGTPYVDQTELDFRDLPASDTQVLGLKECTTQSVRLIFYYLIYSVSFGWGIETINIQ